MKTGETGRLRKNNDFNGSEKLFYVKNKLAKRVRHRECSVGAPMLSPCRAENGILAEWKKWFVISTASQPWKSAFPEYI